MPIRPVEQKGYVMVGVVSGENQVMFVNEIASKGEISTFGNRHVKPDINYENGSVAEQEHISQALDDYVSSTERALQIQVHKGTGRIVVKVVSKKDGKLIREIPSEDFLNLVYKLRKIRGALLDQKA